MRRLILAPLYACPASLYVSKFFSSPRLKKLFGLVGERSLCSEKGHNGTGPRKQTPLCNRVSVPTACFLKSAQNGKQQQNQQPLISGVRIRSTWFCAGKHGSFVLQLLRRLWMVRQRKRRSVPNAVVQYKKRTIDRYRSLAVQHRSNNSDQRHLHLHACGIH